MWLKWFPWRSIVRRAARAHGVLDPLTLLARLRRFAQPSEVAEPLELIRAGIVFHARGLINTRAIQHNLDWVWPYWVERQFDPNDESFIPRSFSITHVNLTHRNWTAVGLPDCDWYPIVDPRGLLTPFWDGWSLDAWILTQGERQLLPSKLREGDQQLKLDDGLTIATRHAVGSLSLASETSVEPEAAGPVCRQRITATADEEAWLVVALRPYNPEGISFVESIAADSSGGWTVNEMHRIEFSERPERQHFANYHEGDVRTGLLDRRDDEAGRGERTSSFKTGTGSGRDARTRGQTHVGQVPVPVLKLCDVGMITAAAVYRISPSEPRRVTVTIPCVAEGEAVPARTECPVPGTWPDALRGVCELRIPDRRSQFLYDAAVRSLVLHAPGDVYPGPYTYKRFWFRDAAFLLHALVSLGLADRAERALDRFPSRQTVLGYFLSQEGEWDSNGEALWILHRYCQLTGREPKPEWERAIRKGGRWITRKRLTGERNLPHGGLFPAGFSAEHLGTNDYYYWDDFWGVAGLRSAAALMDAFGDEKTARAFRDDADEFLAAIERSLQVTASRRSRPALPASPYRRLDSGAVGSLVVGYPLQLWPARDERLLDTAEFLIENCFYEGGFFQDMIHSGINPYLTLHIAQVLLRAGDPRAMDLIDAVAERASPTGQWPEAIHPRTLGGCMGDGQHIWAAAEWILAVRNCFVREEGDRLVLASGIPRRWLRTGEPLAFGPAPTPYGPVSISIEPDREETSVSWQAEWRAGPPTIEVRLPDQETEIVESSPAEGRKFFKAQSGR